MSINGLGMNPYSRAVKTDSDTETPPKTTGDHKPSNKLAPDSSALTMTDFMGLLAVQFQNQDMSNPMSNSEMMGQLTSMATIQAMNTFTELSTTTYMTSMIGQKVQVVVPKGKDDTSTELKKKIGTVTGVDLAAMTIYLDNSTTGFPMGNIMQVGTVPEPPKDPEDPEKPDPDPDPKPESQSSSSSYARSSISDKTITQDKADTLSGMETMPEDKRAALAAGNAGMGEKQSAYQRMVTGPGAALQNDKTGLGTREQKSAAKPEIGPGVFL